MQDQRTGHEANSAAVSGLGVCDVWGLELSPVQWPWLLDELDTIRGPLGEVIERETLLATPAQANAWSSAHVAKRRGG